MYRLLGFDEEKKTVSRFHVRTNHETSDPSFLLYSLAFSRTDKWKANYHRARDYYIEISKESIKYESNC